MSIHNMVQCPKVLMPQAETLSLDAVVGQVATFLLQATIKWEPVPFPRNF